MPLGCRTFLRCHIISDGETIAYIASILWFKFDIWQLFVNESISYNSEWLHSWQLNSQSDNKKWQRTIPAMFSDLIDAKLKHFSIISFFFIDAHFDTEESLFFIDNLCTLPLNKEVKAFLLRLCWCIFWNREAGRVGGASLFFGSHAPLLAGNISTLSKKMFENICYFHLVNYIWTSNSLQLPHNFFFFGNNFHHIGSCAELQQGCVYDSLTLFQQPEQYAIFYTNLKNIQYLISTQTVFNITDIRKYFRKYPPTPPCAAKKNYIRHWVIKVQVLREVFPNK